MYDELVKKLRYCGNAVSCLHCPYWGGCGGSKEDLKRAADAIEELSMKLHGDEAAIAGMKREIERMVVAGKPRWIPVAERLPEPNAVDKHGFAKGYLVKTDRHVMMHTARYTGEWWVLWGYHKVITDNVTHWMPLPEPPKEV